MEKIIITYCKPWNFLPQASRVERELLNAFDDLDVELVEGEHGIFEIKYGDSLIFAKKKDSCCNDRFPRPGEIPDIIRRLGG